jgi:hypothetical protein
MVEPHKLYTPVLQPIHGATAIEGRLYIEHYCLDPHLVQLMEQEPELVMTAGAQGQVLGIQDLQVSRKAWTSDTDCDGMTVQDHASTSRECRHQG